MTFKSGLVSIFAATAVVVGTMAARAEGYTTRIEPRPFYGAVVTLEEGVRVIRPLPPVRHVIINPDHGTPLSLGFNETRVYENRTIRNYVYSEGSGSSESAGSSSSYGRYGSYGPAYVTGDGSVRGYKSMGGVPGGAHRGAVHHRGHHGGHRGGHH